MALVEGVFARAALGLVNARTLVGKVVQLPSHLLSKVTSSGNTAQKEYEEHSEWCKELPKTPGLAERTGMDEVAKVITTIDSQSAAVLSLDDSSIFFIFLSFVASLQQADRKCETCNETVGIVQQLRTALSSFAVIGGTC